VPSADCDLAAPARGKVSFTVQAANFCTNKANLKCNLLSSVTKVAANPAYKSGWLGMTRALALLSFLLLICFDFIRALVLVPNLVE
jgi:hypothetical protein